MSQKGAEICLTWQLLYWSSHGGPNLAMKDF